MDFAVNVFSNCLRFIYVFFAVALEGKCKCVCIVLGLKVHVPTHNAPYHNRCNIDSISVSTSYMVCFEIVVHQAEVVNASLIMIDSVTYLELIYEKIRSKIAFYSSHCLILQTLIYDSILKAPHYSKWH